MASIKERVGRILTLIPYLRQHPGATLGELARFLSCEREEVAADLDAVLMCGVPPYLPTDYVNVGIEGDRVYLQFADQFRRPVRLTLFEALALRLAVASLGGKPLALASELLGKIDAAMPAPLRRAAQAHDEPFYFQSLPPALASKLEQIDAAISAKQKLHIEYYTAGRDAMSDRTVRPYGLVSHAGEWYVVAYCEKRRREVPFRADRIKTLSTVDETFEPPAGFDIEAYRRADMYAPSARDIEVVIRFSPNLARWIREEMPTAEIEPQPDGGIRASLFTSSIEWLVSWLMKFEDQAEVLSPPQLRERMKRACTQMAQRYA